MTGPRKLCQESLIAQASTSVANFTDAFPSMIHAYVPRNGTIERREISGAETIPANAVWVDLLTPTLDEKAQVNQALSIDLPTREEQVEIEPSSRLYQEGETLYLTATVLTQADTPNPTSDVLTFILTRRNLVTLRQVDPQPVAAFGLKLQRQPSLGSSADEALYGLLEAFVDRIADILERLGLELDGLSRAIFDERPTTARRRRGERRDLQAILRSLGRADDIASTARESLHSLSRLGRFLYQATETVTRKDQKARLNSLARDIGSLGEQTAFEARKVNFLLDATLGMINIEQNRIIKIFSVAAVVFLPPTLVASLYGMNFRHMPELDWVYGYPLAVGLMLLAALLPYLFFKRKGWM